MIVIFFWHAVIFFLFGLKEIKKCINNCFKGKRAKAGGRSIIGVSGQLTSQAYQCVERTWSSQWQWLFLARALLLHSTASCLLSFYCNYASKKTQHFQYFLLLLLVLEVFVVSSPFMKWWVFIHRLKQQQNSQPKFVCHCWKASQSHWSLHDWPLHCTDNRSGAASLLSPTDRARCMCKWYSFSPHIWTS